MFWFLAAPFILLFAIYILELMFGLFFVRERSKARPAADIGDPKIAILIPAHNEASIITRTIQRLVENIPSGTRVLVVADNCSDRTAELARKAGAEVVDRFDKERRGKGYALAFGRDLLATDPPDCVIVLDADCTLDKDSAAQLASVAVRQSVPVQATNLVHSVLEAPPVVQISNFAMLVKNLVRQRGMTRLGGAALLTGTGMAFPWSIFATAPLANSDLAEDLALGIAITRQGHTPIFLESAGVSSEAAAEEDTLVQRTRWEHGFLVTARLHAIPLILSGLRKMSRPELFLGFHLLVPPLALLMATGIAMLISLACAVYLGSTPLPFMTLLIIVSLAVIMTVGAWVMEGRDVLSLGALVRIPVYILWKVPVYLKFLGGRETRWIRTRRSDETIISEKQDD
ncbi:glycosyltransferase family 2 protein [Parasphingorhabdus cellanae]|uniref:Glycosyltransferase family 2 protein n=1 Tax=Parasphingorhabdus cellanae TaxID=2806553 RepID=A0ABX7T536_9SPHN|nr:glycosyltransferase family 2 protein [Parasphingorhabdus cellanae]QTD56246.1 glycosyltransferase family 2 protein [Parasphingorhabdus cellanae]